MAQAMAQAEAKPTLEARVSIPKTLLMVALSLGMAVGSGWIAGVPAMLAGEFPPGVGTLIGAVFGWIGLLFFGLVAAGLARQLLRQGPVLVIGPKGVMWRRWSDETIPWKAFERGAITAQMVTLWLRDPQAHRSTRLLGRLAPVNRAIGFGDISLTAQGLDCSFVEMARAAAAHAPGKFRR